MTPAASTLPDRNRPRSQDFRQLFGIREVVIGITLGSALFMLTLSVLITGLQIMPILLERAVAIHDFLGNRPQRSSGGEIYVLGSSVVLHGIDCRVLDSALSDGLRSYNLGLSSARPGFWLLFARDLVQASPAQVVICVDLLTLPTSDRMPADLLRLAGLRDIPGPEEIALLGTYLPEGQLHALTDPAWHQLLRLRRLPYDKFVLWHREEKRPDLRFDGFAANFRSPWIRTSTVSRADLEREISERVALVTESLTDSRHPNLEMLAELFTLLQEKGIPACAVINPVRPEYFTRIDPHRLAALRNRMLSTAAASSIPVLDHSRLFGAESFLDGSHMQADSRRLWSLHLGRDLMQLLATKGP